MGYICGSDAVFPTVEAPNGNLGTDTEVSSTSHEVMEGHQRSRHQHGLVDPTGYEIDDKCAYVFGGTHGQAGQLYNQVISQLHYLTQEEFSKPQLCQDWWKVHPERLASE